MCQQLNYYGHQRNNSSTVDTDAALSRAQSRAKFKKPFEASSFQHNSGGTGSRTERSDEQSVSNTNFKEAQARKDERFLSCCTRLADRWK